MLGVAQSAPQLYLGAGAALFQVRPFQQYAFNAVGPAFTVGVQLSPRWAIQTGATLGWKSLNNSFNRDSAAISLGTYSIDDRVSLLVVPLLVRWTMTAPASRLHLDLLAGASWQHQGIDRSSFYTDATHPNLKVEGSYKTASNAATVMVGPAVRYDLGKQVALTATAWLSADAFGTNYTNDTFGDRLLVTEQLGVQYTFGR